MPTVMTHAIVGIAVGTVAPFARRRPVFWIASAVLPMLPDLDVLGLPLGIPFLGLWGHRGISHSVVAAIIVGLGAAVLVHRHVDGRLLPLALYFTVITASHGILDAFTNGGPGVAFFAPLDANRYFFAWRPLPVSPLASHFFSEWGWDVFRAELVHIWVPALALIGTVRIARRR
jgi:inner membrane protein